MIRHGSCRFNSHPERKTFKKYQKPIDSYFRYFASGEREAAWGFHVSAIGRTRVAPGGEYPPARHPAGRQFSWERGRTLPTLQLVALRAGCGTVEWQGEHCMVSRGDAFLLLPGEWHRYRPDPARGWTEEWFELRGEALEQWIAARLFVSRVIRGIGSPEYWTQWQLLHRVAVGKTFRPPGQLAGLAMSLLAATTQPRVRKDFQDKAREGAALGTARQAIASGERVEAVARQCHMSYPTFHRLFRRAYGLSPKDYAERVRRARAEEILANPEILIKEAAAALGYHSPAHFSSAFRAHYGVSPREWRRSLGKS